MVVGHGTEDGVTIGPLIDDRAVDKADEHVQDAIAHGARLVVGGERLSDGAYGSGSYYAPTVLEGVTPEMLISTEETFGPVAGITRFETEEEAIRVANESIYGLAAYFHTRDYARLLRVAEKLEYGIIGANTGIISAANAPFGGVKESGYGREGGAVGIDEYLDVKYVQVGGVGTVELPASECPTRSSVARGPPARRPRPVRPAILSPWRSSPASRPLRPRAIFAASGGRCSSSVTSGSASSAGSRSRCTAATTSTRRSSSSGAPSSSRSRPVRVRSTRSCRARVGSVARVARSAHAAPRC